MMVLTLPDYISIGPLSPACIPYTPNGPKHYLYRVGIPTTLFSIYGTALNLEP